MNELGCLGRAARGDRPVVAKHAHGLAFDGDPAAYGGGIPVVLEVDEVGIVGDPRDHLTHVIGLLGVAGHHAKQFLFIVAWRCPFIGGRRIVAPAEHTHQVPRLANAIGVVVGQILGGAGHTGVHFRAAEVFVGGDLAGGRFQQWRPGEKHLGAVADHDNVIGEARLIGAAGGRVAVHHGDLRDAGGGQTCLVGEGPRALDEHLGGVVQIGATGFHQTHHRQLVLQGDALQTQRFVQSGRGDGATLDGRVGRRDQAAHSGHIADTGDAAAAGFGAVLVVVHAIAGQVHQAEER